jgi:hypothetical protein
MQFKLETYSNSWKFCQKIEYYIFEVEVEYLGSNSASWDTGMSEPLIVNIGAHRENLSME